FDYDWAATHHHVNGRLPRHEVGPDAVPPQRVPPSRRQGAARGRRLCGAGASGAKLIRYPGLKEEYSLSDFEPDRGVLEELGVPAAEILCVVRTAPSYALYLGGSQTPIVG